MKSIKHQLGHQLRGLLPQAAYLRGCKMYDSVVDAGRFVSCQGFGRQCPFCEHHFRRFLFDAGERSPLFDEVHVIGGGSSEQALCPFCQSFERERHVFLFLKHETTLWTESNRVLHMAPERRVSEKLRQSKNLTYTTGDIDPSRADVKVDLMAIGFPDQTFDAILCNHVLEHVPDDRKAMSEIYRVLRPGGWAMLQVPIADGIQTREDRSVTTADQRLRLYGQSDHLRIYGWDYLDRLQSIGFQVTARSVAEKLGESCVREYGLLPDEKIVIARRP